MIYNDLVKQLPTHLFWDSDISKLDDVEHHEKIVIRTFERGDLEDMALVMAYYGEKICREVLVNATYLPERAKIFASNFLSIKDHAFKSNQVKQHHAL
jgi:hypothetical protein